MTNCFRVSGTLARRLEELGVPPVAVLRQAGLPPGLFEQNEILVTTDEMFALYSAIHEISGDPGIGLKLGSEERPEYYSPIHFREGGKSGHQKKWFTDVRESTGRAFYRPGTHDPLFRTSDPARLFAGQPVDS